MGEAKTKRLNFTPGLPHTDGDINNTSRSYGLLYCHLAYIPPSRLHWLAHTSIAKDNFVPRPEICLCPNQILLGCELRSRLACRLLFTSDHQDLWISYLAEHAVKAP